MSVERFSAVLDHSQHRGADLLLMLVLADYANSEGHCWPTIDTLAQRTRTDRRTVLRSLKNLEASGEVIIRHNRHGNQYLVVVGMDERAINDACQRYFGQPRPTLSTIPRSDTMPLQSDTTPPREWRDATTDETTRSDTTPPQKWRDATSEVTSCTLDPSITINDPSNSAGSDDPALRATASAEAATAPPGSAPESVPVPAPPSAPVNTAPGSKSVASAANKPLIAIIEAYWQGLPAPPAGKPYARSLRAAKRLHEAGYTPEQVLAYLQALYRDSYWRGKVVSLEYVADHLPTWLVAQQSSALADEYSPYPVATGRTPKTVEEIVWEQIWASLRAQPAGPAAALGEMRYV